MPVVRDPRQQEVIQLNAQRVNQELATYEQPPIRVGRQVRWSPVADFGYGGTVLAWVDKVVNKTVNLSLMGEGYSGTIRTEVPHISDPRLRLNTDWQANGAWDYAEEENDPQIMVDKLTDQVKKLTDKVERLSTAQSLSSRKIEELEQEIVVLRNWADTLGVDDEPLGPAQPPVKPAATKSK